MHPVPNPMHDDIVVGVFAPQGPGPKRSQTRNLPAAVPRNAAGFFCVAMLLQIL